MAGYLYDDAPNGIWHFLLLTVVLGGMGALASGRAIAAGWKSFAIVPFYMIAFAAFLRFLNYALFDGELLSVSGYVVAFTLTILAAGYGYRSCRVEQVTRQYSWIFKKAGPLGWKPVD